MLIVNLLNVAGSICFILLLLSLPLTVTVVRRQYDPLFGKVGGVKGEVGVPLWSFFYRSLTYAGCVTFKSITKRKPYLYKLYDGYNFRGKATWSVKIISFVTIYSTLGALFFGVLLSVIGYFFHVSTSS